MSLLRRLFSSSDSKKTAKKAKSGNAQHDTGAGPALAAHSKDAKSSGASGQNPAAAKKQGETTARKPSAAADKKARQAASPGPAAKQTSSAAKSKQGSAKKP